LERSVSGKMKVNELTSGNTCVCVCVCMYKLNMSKRLNLYVKPHVGPSVKWRLKRIKHTLC
jgi:hypothetical protein